MILEVPAVAGTPASNVVVWTPHLQKLGNHRIASIAVAPDGSVDDMHQHADAARASIAEMLGIRAELPSILFGNADDYRVNDGYIETGNFPANVVALLPGKKSDPATDKIQMRSGYPMNDCEMFAVWIPLLRR